MSFSLSKVLSKHKGRVFEKWIFDAHSPLLSSAAVGDIDGDGVPEVVFGTKEGSIHCLDHDANERWVYKTGGTVAESESYFLDLESLHAISGTPVLADINTDGKKEVIFGADDGHVYALTHEGKLLWKYKVGGSIKCTPKVVDLNNNGRLEIIVTSTAKKLVVLSSEGELVVSYKTPSSSQATPGILRGDKGKPTLIVFGTDSGTIHAINTQEDQLWTFDANDRVTAEPVFAQMGNETIILVGSWDGSLYALSLDGTRKWQFKTEGAIYNKVAVGDVNDDGKNEIVFGSCDNNVYALTMSGERVWSYETDFWVMAPPLLFDVDKDGKTEVIAGSFDNSVYILEGAGSYELEYVPGLSGMVHQAGHYADVLSSEPGERQGKRLWQYRTKGMVVGCTLLEEKHLIVNVKSGFVDALGHQN